MTTQQPFTAPIVSVHLTEDGDALLAETLAERFRLPITRNGEGADDTSLRLWLNRDGLSLHGNGMVLRADLTQMLPRLKENNLRGELLVRAAKLRDVPPPWTAVDATAGFGEDALLLAASGYTVTLFEYDAVIAALLQDSLRRAAQNDVLRPIVSRMTLLCQDSITSMAALPFAPDVVLLDPMFPERQKSAFVKKKFQLLQQLERPCSAEEELLNAALKAARRRVIVKRPAKGPILGQKKPSYSVEGKSVRYDCLIPTPRSEES